MIPWFIFAIASAILNSLASITQKKTLFKEHAMEFSTVLALFNAILVIPFFLTLDYSSLALLPLAATFLVALLASIAFLLVARSIRHMEISEASPLLSLAPGLIALLALFFLRETLTPTQISGLILLVLGAYLLEAKHKGLLAPFQAFRKSVYIHLIFVAMILYSIVSLLDRFILSVLHFPLDAYMAFAHLFLAVNFLLMLTFFHDGMKGVKHGIVTAGRWIFLIAVLTVCYRFLHLRAVEMANVGLVASLAHTSAFLTTLLGGELFHEKNLARKSFSCLIIVVGAVLIIAP